MAIIHGIFLSSRQDCGHEVVSDHQCPLNLDQAYHTPLRFLQQKAVDDLDYRFVASCLRGLLSVCYPGPCRDFQHAVQYHIGRTLPTSAASRLHGSVREKKMPHRSCFVVALVAIQSVRRRRG
jgi:hypothetical protein